MAILNLTKNPATPEQRESGVIEIKDELKDKLNALLSFTELPDRKEIMDRVHRLSSLIYKHLTGVDKEWHLFYDHEIGAELSKADIDAILIGGEPYLMGPLELEIENYSTAVYAFYKETSVMAETEDGLPIEHVLRTHVGFVKSITSDL